MERLDDSERRNVPDKLVELTLDDPRVSADYRNPDVERLIEQGARLYLELGTGIIRLITPSSGKLERVTVQHALPAVETPKEMRRRNWRNRMARFSDN